MSVRKESVVKDLVEDLVEDLKGKKAAKGSQESAKGTTQEEVQAKAPGNWIEMPFLHNMTPDVRGKWNLQDFDPAGPGDAPNMNLSVMGLILATNIESTVGEHAWSLVEYSLGRLGFTNIVHHYFEEAEKVNHPAVVFGRSTETVNGKYVVAAVYRGSSSFVDFISDAEAEPGGFL